MAATAEVLQIISQTPESLSAVFSTLLLKALRLCHAEIGILFTYDGDKYTAAAMQGTSPEFSLWLNKGPIRAGEHSGLGRIAISHQIVHVKDIVTEDIYRSGDPLRLATADLGGARTFLAVPMMKADHLVGAFTIYRQDVCPFDQAHIDLVKSFSSQAVIAIENVRLINETREALERQTATADILKVIASSPSDVQPVFEAIAASANRLIGGYSTAVLRFIDGMAHLAAFTPANPAADAVLKSSLPAPTAAFKPFELAARGEPMQIADTEAFADERLLEISRARGYRSALFAPLMNGSLPIGLIGVTRVAPGTFAPHHVQLLKTFADQAVIAIENARLFNETQEALERQTATADILKVIASSPDDVQPVFEAIAERSNRLVNGLSTAVFSVVDDAVRLMSFTSVSAAADAALKAITDVPLSAFPVGEAMRKGEVAQIADTEDEATPDFLRDVARLRGWRSSLTVPMLREGILIGIIAVTRVEPGLFDDHHVQLLKTFADQAVIAISNVGLFNEVQERTRELSQSLDDLRAAQDRLVQTEKLASLGQLTAGIAHEIKNPLNFVNNFSALSAELTDELNDVLKSVALGEKIREDVDELTKMLKDNLEKVVQHGKRADSIVKNMLLHSREGSGEHRPADINLLLDESLNLAYHGARAEKPGFGITLQRNFDADAGSVELFPQEITRAFLNLISNSFYAATKRKTETGESGFEPILTASTKDLGSAVEIRIRDNGTGIPAEVQEKMFNPFFTTKPAGEGTGLGLSMTHDIIVKQHGGRIDVATEPGQFTEFTIVLPRKSNLSGRVRGET
jgi:signal transduction histidine kinase